VLALVEQGAGLVELGVCPNQFSHAFEDARCIQTALQEQQSGCQVRNPGLEVRLGAHLAEQKLRLLEILCVQALFDDAQFDRS
jgi:hypothetical protein